MRKIFISDTIGLDEKIVAVADENLMAAFFLAVVSLWTR